MTRLFAFFLAGYGLLSSTASTAAELTILLEPGSMWSVVEEDASFATFRYGSTAHGVRVGFPSPQCQACIAGVSPIADGTTRSIQRNTNDIPMFSWPASADPVRDVRVIAQGPDLLVQFAGAPLNEMSTHPQAPGDPVLSWVRLRPRDDSWRMILTGVHRWSLPETAHAHRGDGREVLSAWGSFTYSTEADRVQCSKSGDIWVWDTLSSVHTVRPYPKTGITWVPKPN